MKCVHCDALIEENLNFCPHCGNPIVRKQVSDSFDSEDNKSKETSEEEGASVSGLDADDISESKSQVVGADDESDRSSVVEVGPKVDADAAGEKKAEPKRMGVKVKRGLIALIIVAILILIGSIASCVATPQPFSCDETITVDTVVFDYPSDWSQQEGDDSEGERIYLYPPVSGMVMITADYKHLDLNAASFEEYLKGANMKRLSNYKTISLNDNTAYKAEISWTNSENNEEFKGYIVLIGMEYSTVSCLALVGQGQDGRYASTMEAIVDSARISGDAITYEVTFESEDKVIESGSFANTSGGAVVTPPLGLERSGFILDGWKVKSGAENADFKRTGSTYILYKTEGNVVLEAVWSPAFTVTFTDGLGTTLNTQSVKQGGSAIAPANPTRQGYTFNGWSGDFKNVSSDLTIEAKWTKIPTTSEANALKKAKSYLNYSAFSYEGLIEQLEFEKFSYEDAVYAVDNCGADWYAQAAKKAKSYMDFSSFSRGSLIDQLEFEGFTPEEAAYGADSVGL